MAKREPRYTKAERAERAKEVEALRRRAVKSWNADDGTAAKSTALVIMTFAEYLDLYAAANYGTGKHGN